MDRSPSHQEDMYQQAAEDALRTQTNRAVEFVSMVLRSVEGGGYIVTFSEADVEEMRQITGD